eukprot:TRINITY_DN11503_c0_g3_i1.p1 TRINITY_DN11503_c0_g3~~TRINITY_DN11503_c0_g3_i1.p1  ORF type:complete len:647 (+),score=245.64 TRINITY_DN11503_c0_g3_i1:242-2182(+)
MAELSVRESQKAAIIRMLHFNTSAEDSERNEGIWKVLVYDKACSDIISPLLRVGELRTHGVTLHIAMDGERDAIPDVPAVYFVQPTQEAVDRIAADCAKGLYSAFHLNFSTALPAPLLERLAHAAVKSNAASRIARVHDQHIHFVSLEDRLFSLRLPRSYCRFNGRSSEAESVALMDTVVEGLFSVIVTLGVVPVIRCRRSTSAEMIAERLDQRLREHLLNTVPGAAAGGGRGAVQRPLLVLVDRNEDLSVMAHHPWTYQAMVHDLLPLHLNRVKVNVEEAGTSEEGAQSKEITYDLDPTMDPFWETHRKSSFPEMASAAHEQLNEFKQAKERLGSLGISMESEEAFDSDTILDKTQHLRKFASSVPQLRAKKKLIDQHINIATALLNEIRARELNVFVTEEERLIGRVGSKSEVLQLLRDPSKGSEMDKLRLLIIFYLCKEELSASDLDEMEQALPQETLPAGFADAVLGYLKKTKAFSSGSAARTLRAPSTSAPSTSGLGFSFVQRGMSSISDVFSMVQSGVESALRNEQKEFYVTRVVKAAMENGSKGAGGAPSQGVDVSRYLYFDPKVQKLRNGDVPRKKGAFRHALVFTIGGGCFAEYQNLQSYCSSGEGAQGHIVYGSTELLSGSEFLSQLAELGGHPPH